MRRALVAVALVGVAGATAAVVLYLRYRSPDVRGSSTAEFVPAETRSATPPPLPRPRPRPARQPAPRRAAPSRRPRPALLGTIVWATYGYDARRLREGRSALRPPFRRIWTFHGRALLEFPPAVAYGRLYLPTFDGRFYALDARTGRALWRFRSGRCSWASPAVAGGLVYATFLNRPRNCDLQTAPLDGEVVAFDARTGRVRWRTRLGPTESSPLVAGGLVYVGDWRGGVYALDARSGRVRWSYDTGGPVKGSAALAAGRIYIGSYDGHVYALDVRSGRLVWRASAQPRFGGQARFYATPAVAYGRVYIGATDGKVYSFGARSGRLRWSTSTDGYVYSSAAVSRKLVLVGSYDGSFYAFDAATGDERWRFRTNGPISGSPTVLGDVVYFSTLRERTYALRAPSGALLWTYPDGKYSPVVADAQRLYLVGRGRLYGMVELTADAAPARGSPSARTRPARASSRRS
jgi:outer membrane protein assembly factor BamB